jgi:hypothetical protein
VAALDEFAYHVVMSLLLRKLVRHVVQKAASNPDTRDKVVRAAGGVVDEVKQIAKEEDRAYAAGKAFRRAFDKLQNGQ